MPEISPSRYTVTAGWDDVPHLDEKTKKELLASTMPHLRDARSKGTPSLGSGAIYPIPPSEIMVDEFQIPKFWPKCYALDVGWKKTAVVWGAWDRTADIVYLYAEHYRGEAQPATHVAAIQARGKWIPGVIDPAANGRNVHDGAQLLQDYIELGLNLQPADNLVESGLFAVLGRLQTGRLKIFRSMQRWFAEYQIYRRDEKGQIVKANDHLMDCTRYLIGPETIRKGRTSGLARAIVQPQGSLMMGPGNASAGDIDVGY